MPIVDIENRVKYLAVEIGSIVTLIFAIIRIIILAVFGHFALIYGAFNANGNLFAFPGIFGLLIAIDIVILILALLPIHYANKINGNESTHVHNGFIILAIGIILLVLGAGDYIGPIFIILGGFAFYVSHKTISINI